VYDFLRERERDVSLGRYVRKQSHFGTREISELSNRMVTSNPIDHPRARVSHSSRYRCLAAISGRWGVRCVREGQHCDFQQQRTRVSMLRMLEPHDGHDNRPGG
jgi:hypothetical protein